ncbi:wat1-related protein at1g09380 [Phtheirospermum japonicum]|uniref:WAT1-related protein n=1 Tax=Phtheirospermum japonicum TaxID=374723 RepID=A0A830C810_9LAMI|nr:wat1-related protein at1g09380 [Phtheirospermum japonicum]
MGVRGWIMDTQVPLGMLVVQLITAGLQILSRVILSEGTFIFALITYRHVVAALSIVPFALYFERGAVKKLTFAAFFWLFMVALTGISMAMGLFYYGLKDTSATYATNFLNLIPVFTFLFATIFRIEKLGLGTKAGKIKTVGAMLCLAGALTIALYKGQSFHLSHYYKHDSIQITAKLNKTRGTVSLIASCLSYGLWFILQVKLFKVFPYKYWATLLTCIIGSAQAAVIGLCLDREPSSWRLGLNLQLVTIIYSGILATAATFSLISWAITQRGPTYPSMFNPLALILIAILEALILGEEISVGSLIGMALIIVGLYSFLWGKNKDIKAAMVSLKGGNGGGGEDIEKGASDGGVGEDIEKGASLEAVESQSPATTQR